MMAQKKMLKGWGGKIDRLKSRCCCCAGSGDITNYARRILMTRCVERRKERMKMEKSSWTFFPSSALQYLFTFSSLSRSQHQHLGLIFGAVRAIGKILFHLQHIICVESTQLLRLGCLSLVGNSILLVFYCNQTVEFYHSLLLLLTKLCARVGPVHWALFNSIKYISILPPTAEDVESVAKESIETACQATSNAMLGLKWPFLECLCLGEGTKERESGRKSNFFRFSLRQSKYCFRTRERSHNDRVYTICRHQFRFVFMDTAATFIFSEFHYCGCVGRNRKGIIK